MLTSAKMRLVSLLFVAAVLSFFASSQVRAESYEVEAKVSAAIATEPAIISSPSTGSEFSVNNTTISGTCPVTTPSQLVLIWRNGIFAGSGPCNSGTFSINITLVSGQNSLIPKLRNVTNDAGPSGSAILVSYTPPVIPENPPPAQIETGTTTDIAQDSNQTTQEQESPAKPASNLSLSTEDGFVVFDMSGETSLTINIVEGDSPYTVIIDWGDGTKQTYTFDSAGEKILTHKYATKDNKTISIAVTDESGKTVFLTLGAVSLTTVPQEQTTGKSNTSADTLGTTGWIAVAAASLVIATSTVSILAGTSMPFLKSPVQPKSPNLSKKKGAKRGKK
jgi:hypothetical protein